MGRVMSVSFRIVGAPGYALRMTDHHRLCGEVDYPEGNGARKTSALSLRHGERDRVRKSAARLAPPATADPDDLAADAPISHRHLSFLESGRAGPSRETIDRLAEALELPPRALNELYLAAGCAPARAACARDAPELEPVRAAARAIISNADPAPALIVDRRWTLVEANAAAMRLMGGAAAHLLAPPINALRISLHPGGLGPSLLNYREWRAHIAARLTREADLSGDGALITLRDELLSYPVPPGAKPGPARPASGREGRVALPLVLSTPLGALSLMSATTVFGAAVEVFTSELIIETFWPASAEDKAILTALASS